MAVPGIVGTNGGGRTNNGAFSVTPPVGAAGYLAVASWGGSSTGLTPPSGWTLVSRGAGATDDFSNWGIWTGTSGAGSSWTLAGASASFGVALVIGGYNGAITVDAWNRVGASGTNAVPACPSVNATEAGLVVRAAMVQNFSGAVTVGYPAAATDGRVFHTQTPSERWTAAIAHQSQGAAGATGTGQYTIGTATPWDPHAATVVIKTAGASPTERTASGGLTISGTAARTIRMARTAAGVLTLGGLAPATPRLARTATGGLAIGGTAPATLRLTRTAAGELTLEVTSPRTIRHSRDAEGTLTLSGTADGEIGGLNQERTAEGSLTLSGTAEHTVRLARTAEGVLNLAGTSEELVRLTRTAQDTLVLSGLAEGFERITREASGTLTLTGDASGLVRYTRTALGELTIEGIAVGTVADLLTGWVNGQERPVTVTLMIDGVEHPVSLSALVDGIMH